jgi:hypothetical protein
MAGHDVVGLAQTGTGKTAADDQTARSARSSQLLRRIIKAPFTRSRTAPHVSPESSTSARISAP